jgi:PKD repeat protein
VRKFCVFLFLFLPFVAVCQLKADFIMNKPGGCAPLEIQFKNTSTASSNATYEWDLGNGNRSLLQNPGAVYREEKNFTVTLTVRDSNKVVTKSATVSVYKKPIVNFDISAKSGCAPCR